VEHVFALSVLELDERGLDDVVLKALKRGLDWGGNLLFKWIED
jgi:hypothetical protein